MKTKLEEIVAGTRLGTVGRVLNLVQVAEEEIASATTAHPAKAKELRAAFQDYLFPGELANFSADVYRSHAREVLGRVARGEDVSPGTDAECLVALSLASLKAPLASGHLAAMEHVFAKVYPNHKDTAAPLGREAYAGETEEILTELRKKIGRRRG